MFLVVCSYPCSHTFGDPSASDGNYDNTGTSPLNPSPNPKPRFAHTLLHASKPISPPQNLTYGHNEQNFDASCHPFCPLVDASGPGYETVHPVNRYQWPWYFLHPFSLNAPVDGPYDACTGGNMNGRLKIGRARPETSPRFVVPTRCYCGLLPLHNLRLTAFLVIFIAQVLNSFNLRTARNRIGVLLIRTLKD